MLRKIQVTAILGENGSRLMPASRVRSLCLVFALSVLTAVKLPAQANGHTASSDSLHQFSSSVEDLVGRVTPSVVEIEASGVKPVEDDSQGKTDVRTTKWRSIGSGVIVDPDGYIVTNAHVVSGAQRIQVVLTSASTDESPLRSLSTKTTTAKASLVGISEEIDLAVLKIEGHGLPALSIGDYGHLKQGQVVFAFGSPGGLRNSVTMGVVSAVARQPNPDSRTVYIQTDAPINGGNSGGPLVDIDGTVVGLNTLILTQGGGSEGIGFAIPSDIVSIVYPQLRKYGCLHHGEIGAAVQGVTPDLAAALGLPKDSGVIVSDVVPGGPADIAGLKVQDQVISVDDHPAESVPDFFLSFFNLPHGDRTKLAVLRGREKLLIDVRVTQQEYDIKPSRPEWDDSLDALLDSGSPTDYLVSELGVVGVEIDAKVAAMLPGLRMSSGVIIVATKAGAGGPGKVLEPGDVIHALNGSVVKSVANLRADLENVAAETPTVLQIERNGIFQYVTLPLE
jgi:serine protease Do